MHSHNLPVTAVVVTALIALFILLPIGAMTRVVRADRVIRSEWAAFEMGIDVARQMATTSKPTRSLSTTH